MNEPKKTLTDFQKISHALQIFDGYLSKENPGTISCEHDEIFVSGVHRDALGGDDLKKLKAMGWSWDKSFDAWKHFT